MITYAEFRPTAVDSHWVLEEREDWYVVPCARNRDSDPWENSNFDAALKLLGGEQNNVVEIYRFGHWGPGWFEIILVNPKIKKYAAIAEGIEQKLKEYPYLDEEDVVKRERD